MKLKIKIDQTASIRAGVGAPNSTTIVDVDPATLPEDLRGWFADHYRVAHGELDCRDPVLVLPLTPERVIESIRERMEAAAAAEEALMDECRAVIAERRTKESSTQKKLVPDWPENATTEMRDPGADWQAELDRENAAREQAARAAKQIESDAIQSAKAERAARFQRIATELSPLLGERLAAKLATEQEVLDHLAERERSRLGLMAAALGWDNDEPVDRISNEQWESLKEVRAKLPPSHTCEVVRVWDDPDPDSEEGHQNERTIARLKWECEGFPVGCDVAL